MPAGGSGRRPGQLRGGELRVALGGGEPLVAEQFLDGAQVGAFFQQMRAEGVAQRVRVHVGGESAQNGDALDDATHAARGEPCLAPGLPSPRSCRLTTAPARGSLAFRRPPPAAPSAPQDTRAAPVPPRRPAELALLLAFAAHQDRFVGPVNVFEFSPVNSALRMPQL